MLLYDLVKSLDAEIIVSFEYCYYGKNSQLIPDSSLSFKGKRDELLLFIENSAILKHLYACGGECNDFEMLNEGDLVILRFTDFR